MIRWLGGRLGARVGEPDVGVQRDDVPVRVGGIVGGVELAGAVQRRPAVAAPAEHVLLLVDRHAVPELDEHPDQPDDLVGAALRPAGLGGIVDPDQAARQRSGRVGGAVLEPQQVPRGAGRPWRGGVALHLPAQLHAAAGVLGDVADGVVDRIGMVGAQLEQQVTMQPGGLEEVVGERPHRGQLQRLAVPEAVTVVEQARSHGQRDGQPVRRDRGPQDVAVGGRLPDPEVGRGTAGGEEPGAVGQFVHKKRQVSLVSGGAVEGGDARERLLVRWSRREHPGLVRAMERVCRFRDRAAASRPPRRPRAHRRSARRRPARSRPRPIAVPLRKLRRLTFTGVRSLGGVQGGREGLSGPGEPQGDPERRRASRAPRRLPHPLARAPQGRLRRATPTGR